MNKKLRTILIVILVTFAVFSFLRGGNETANTEQIDLNTVAEYSPVASESPAVIQETSDLQSEDDYSQPEESIQENGIYSSKDDVALYIHLFGHLPSNYIKKDEAEKLGWVSSKGNLWDVTDGKSIGGDYFGNYEKKLPVQNGRKYYECDVDFDGGYRGAERIIYSNDGLIFYTDDHYNTFEQLY